MRNEIIRGFCVDYNWMPDGSGPAIPGTYSKANPDKLVDWHMWLGCNVIQTFCVSYNGYAWYPSKLAPMEPGLDPEFITKMITRANDRKMMVLGYFNIGGNPYLVETKPERSRPNPACYIEGVTQIFDDEYLDYFCGVVREALVETQIEGFMIDWFRHPFLKREIWISAERKWYEKLMGEAFPLCGEPSEEYRLAYERAMIEYAWRRVKDTVDSTRKAIIWTNHPFNNQLPHGVDYAIWNNNILLKEVDWVLNESPDLSLLSWIEKQTSPNTRIIQNICGWAEHNANIWQEVNLDKFDLYGFASPDKEKCLPELGTKDYSNIEIVRKAFHNINYENV